MRTRLRSHQDGVACAEMNHNERPSLQQKKTPGCTRAVVGLPAYNPGSKMGKSAVIIGGGVGGLSAAIHLARRGIRVTLLEKNARVGGKLNLWAVPHPARPTDRL